MDKERISVRIEYTEEQKRDISSEMANKVAEVESLKASLDSIKKQYKADIEAAETFVTNSARKLREGSYFGDVECHVIYDFENRNVYYIRCDNCLIAKMRDMRPEEMQMTIEDAMDETE